eukprot:COSAG01_NODE_37031_length_509_cov_1.200000_1_plen_47_part_00
MSKLLAEKFSQYAGCIELSHTDTQYDSYSVDLLDRVVVVQLTFLAF